MKEKNHRLLTTSQFAERAGVTVRAIRFYDKEDLLKPSGYNDAGYRLYSEEDFARLQRILTLKFIGLSLEEIKHAIRSDINERDFRHSLLIQKRIMTEKMNHLGLVIKAINEAEQRIEKGEELQWDSFIHIIEVIDLEKIWIEQYKNAENLHTRIKLHDQFSTNRIGWHSWLFERLQLQSREGAVRVLELGCGEASLWLRNIERIPEACEIILTDFSAGMIHDAIINLGPHAERFHFRVADAQEIPFEQGSFDIVIADHMLYHVANREKAFAEMDRVLKPGGYFYASTIGETHLVEIKGLLSEFDPKIVISETNFAQQFGLENGAEQLAPWFQQIQLRRYEDSLNVTEVGPLVNYMRSTSGNTKEMLVAEKLQRLMLFLENKLTQKGVIQITKDTGVFEARKK